MSPEERKSNDAFEALIVSYLEAEKSGQNLDRDGLIEQNPELANSLREFFANYEGRTDWKAIRRTLVRTKWDIGNSRWPRQGRYCIVGPSSNEPMYARRAVSHTGTFSPKSGMQH